MLRLFRKKKIYSPLDKKHLRGFTLTEIIVAAVVLSVAVGGMWASFVGSKRHVIKAKTYLMALHNARYILEKLKADVRQTGSSGWLSTGTHDVTSWLPTGTGTFKDKYNATAVYVVTSPVSGSNCSKVEVTMTWDDIQ